MKPDTIEISRLTLHLLLNNDLWYQYKAEALLAITQSTLNTLYNDLTERYDRLNLDLSDIKGAWTYWYDEAIYNGTAIPSTFVIDNPAAPYDRKERIVHDCIGASSITATSPRASGPGARLFLG